MDKEFAEVPIVSSGDTMPVATTPVSCLQLRRVARRLFGLLAGLTLVGALANPAGATTIPYRTDGELVALADRVVHGRVVSVTTESSARRIYTVTRVAVLEDFTGVNEAVVEIRELGGRVGHEEMWIPGAPRFLVGQEVLVLLERSRGGAYRTVALSFSAFGVTRTAGGATVQRVWTGAEVVGEPTESSRLRTLDEFRQVVGAVKGTRSIVPAAAAAVPAGGASPRVDDEFTLLGGGMRWRQADTGTPVNWYRNPDRPHPLTSGDIDQEIQTALAAWTNPTTASLTLAHGGTRSAGGETNVFCTSVNAGAGLVSFEDPQGDIGSGVLAIGGGCPGGPVHTVNGHSFQSFTHGFVVFNDAAQLSASYKTPQYFTRVLAHEIGHGIGLGHPCAGDSGVACTTALQSNLMYPYCCYPAMPLPPAIGPDDLAGLEFIYPQGGTPAPTCTFTVSPTSASPGASGGVAAVSVTASAPSCAWTASSQAGWITISGTASGTGSATVQYAVASNAGTARSGTLTVAGHTVTINQAAAPPPTCTFTVSPTSVSFGPGGGSASIGVSPSTAPCAWTAVSNSGWLTVTSGASGTTTGQVSYGVAPNPGVARSGTMTIAGRTVTIFQDADADTDGDGLPDSWEIAFGLNPNSGAGSDGPSGDPDGDGATNLQEYQRQPSTHPRGFATRYLAEGAVNAFFQTEIALLNPAPTQAITLVRIQPEGQAERTMILTVPGLTRRTLTSSLLSTLTTAPFSTVVESDAALVVDRTMSWDATGYGAHAETSIAAPSTTWYLAEGSTAGDFALFYLLQNPNSSAVTATVTFLRPAGSPPVSREYVLGPNSRTTIPVDTAAPELASTDVSGVVSATQPIIVERAMYLNRPGQPFVAGHESAGVTATSNDWFLAEGATGSFFELFVLIANPNPQPASVTIDYLLPNGTTLAKTYGVAANSRFTIWVDEEQFPAQSGNRALANTSVAMRVRSTNGVPIIVERAMWWPAPVWYEAHNAPGTTVTGTKWALAGGEVGGASSLQTYVLVANTSATAGQARVSVYFEDGTTAQTLVTLLANSRSNVSIGDVFPASNGRRFGVIVESLGATPAQIVVERAMYSNAGGALWSAGTAAVATRLLP
jgi:hypothetical protein